MGINKCASNVNGLSVSTMMGRLVFCPFSRKAYVGGNTHIFVGEL